MNATYVQPRYEGPDALLEAIATDDPDKLGPMIIAAALYEEDFDFVQRMCIQRNVSG